MNQLGELEKEYDKFLENGAEIVAIAHQDTKDARKSVDNSGATFPILIDSSGKVARRFNVYDSDREIAIPSVFIVDKSGDIVWTYVGSDQDRPDTSEILDNLPPGDAIAKLGFGDGLLYADDFSDPDSGWEQESGKDVHIEYKDGQYHIIVSAENMMGLGGPDKKFSDFTIEVDTTQIDGLDDNQYGVILRYVDIDNFYAFKISGDGQYSFTKSEGEWQTLIKWTKSKTIRRGLSTNHIRVTCQGDKFIFYVNGEKVAEHRDDSFTEGDIGLFAGRYEDEGDVHVSFDNLKVWAVD
jgi:hypothetical protein